MSIQYLDGSRLKNAIVAGAQRVIQLQEHLNNINVFPVPDGDTGTNMALTLKSVADAALNSKSSDLGVVSALLAEHALMGARGNSGAILAQFFQGLAHSFEGKAQAGMQHFAEAAQSAAACAREAIAEPKEGTILTVLHDWAEYIHQKYGEAGDFIELVSDSLDEAKRSLQETPTKLKVLAKAGVVDAGAKGFVEMLEGMSHFLSTGKIKTLLQDHTGERSQKAQVTEAAGDITFRYCTECFVRGAEIDIKTLRQQLIPLGNSLIVAGGAQSLRVHIHTNEPDAVFELAAEYGEVVSTKHEDMWAQHREAHGATQAADIALITDSTCDLPPDYLIRKKIHIVPLTVNFGPESYLDRVSITNREFYKKLAEGTHHPTTSQPAPADFKQAFELASENHTAALAILISSALSGTYQAGLTAENFMQGLEIEVIDSKTLSGSLGLLVMVAAEAIEEGCSLPEIERRVHLARERVRMFVSVQTTESLVRGGRVSKSKGLLSKLLNIQPILSIMPDGHAESVAKSRGGMKNREKTLEMIINAARGLQNLRFIICHAAAPEAADFFAIELKKAFAVDAIHLLEISPVLAAHAGIGTVAINFLGFQEGEAPWWH